MAGNDAFGRVCAAMVPAIRTRIINILGSQRQGGTWIAGHRWQMAHKCGPLTLRLGWGRKGNSSAVDSAFNLNFVSKPMIADRAGMMTA